jgi:hypothetical protein
MRPADQRKLPHVVCCYMSSATEGEGSTLDGYESSEDIRPLSWADAFPWLSGAAGVGAVDWWSDVIATADPVTRASRLATISELAMARLTRWTIGEIFPGLPADIDVGLLNLPARARNVLGRYGRSEPGWLQETALEEMLDWNQVGFGTADAILRTLADISTSGATPTVRSAFFTTAREAESPPGFSHQRGWVDSVIEDFTSIAGWYSTVGTLDQPLVGGQVPAGMPAEIIQARERIEAAHAKEILGEDGCRRDLAVLFDDALSVLDPRALDVLGARLFADDPQTLDQLGRKYDLTRERMRQIEGKARGTVMSLMSEQGPIAMAAAVARDLIGTILPLEQLLAVVPALGRQVAGVGQPAWRVLDRLDDAYEIEDGWCVLPTMKAALELTRTQLAERTNQYGVARFDELELVGSREAEQRPALTAAWLAHCGYVISGEYVLTRTSSVGDYAAAVLFLEGSPLSTQEIVDRFVFERSARSLGNALGEDARFDRVDRDRWALKEWGMEAYSGIRSLVRELVARAGGRARLEDIVEHITGRYSVSASSVVAYASSAPFSTKEGVVSLGVERSTRKAPRRTRRLFRRADGWMFRVRITTEHLRGSGFVAPVAVATILGLSEGQTLQLESALGPQTVFWTGIQPSFGTIRRFLMDQDVAAGAEAFLVMGDNGSFGFEQARELVGEPLADVLSFIGAPLMTDRSAARAALSAAIELPADAPIASIIGDYRSRGDDDVAELLLVLREELETGHTAMSAVDDPDFDTILDLL